jgi:hypothetical protein
LLDKVFDHPAGSSGDILIRVITQAHRMKLSFPAAAVG